jgi:hypothetical protein
VTIIFTEARLSLAPLELINRFSHQLIEFEPWHPIRSGARPRYENPHGSQTASGIRGLLTTPPRDVPDRGQQQRPDRRRKPAASSRPLRQLTTAGTVPLQHPPSHPPTRCQRASLRFVNRSVLLAGGHLPQLWPAYTDQRYDYSRPKRCGPLSCQRRFPDNGARPAAGRYPQDSW